MADDVRMALQERGLMAAFRARPEHQQNDYLWWITDAKRPATRRRRLNQMLDELESDAEHRGLRAPAPHPGRSA